MYLGYSLDGQLFEPRRLLRPFQEGVHFSATQPLAVGRTLRLHQEQPLQNTTPAKRILLVLLVMVVVVAVAAAVVEVVVVVAVVVTVAGASAGAGCCLHTAQRHRLRQTFGYCTKVSLPNQWGGTHQ